MKLLGMSPQLTAAAPMLELFSDRSTLQAALRVEAALAQAEGACGVIPADAVAPIVDAADASLYDLEQIAAGALRGGTMVIPIVNALTAEVAKRSPAAAGYVHFGATTQDITDTALVLQLREAVALIVAEGERLHAAMSDLAQRHADTVMLGRTLLQPATPITFGLKAAGWAGATARGLERVRAAADKALVLQFGSASGTLAPLGREGLRVSEALGAALGLPVPPAPWHGHKDRLAELASAIVILVGSISKAARDVSLLMQAEVGEVSEPLGGGRGGSSTMPHKRNPIASMIALACAHRLPGLLASLMAGLAPEHERALGAWQAEGSVHAEICLCASGALAAMNESIGGLKVDAHAMSANIARLKGLIFAERLMLALAPRLTRAEAHHLVEALVAQAVASGSDLLTVASAERKVIDALGADALGRLFDPADYLGSTRELIERTLAEHSISRNT